MGKFDKILICTDWDGTLFYNQTVSNENINAIKYFQQNGGFFTVCSGRYFEFLRKFENLVHPNTYTACYNGGLIIDIDKMDVLYEAFCDDYMFELVDKVLKLNIPIIGINVYDSIRKFPVEYTVEEYLRELPELKKQKHYKILLKTNTPKNGIRLSRLANKLDLGDYIAVRSWNVSLEIMKRSNAKGEALKRIAEAIGAKLTIGIGNYENDIELLTAADIGYAVGDSPEIVKKAADRITVSASESAVAKIIYQIEKELRA